MFSTLEPGFCPSPLLRMLSYTDKLPSGYRHGQYDRKRRPHDPNPMLVVMPTKKH